MNGKRLEKIREAFGKKRIDAFLVTQIDNIHYLTGFTGSTATVVITPDRSIILVDPRYTIQATDEVKEFEVWQYMLKTGIEAAAEVVDELSPERLGFEAESLTVEQHRRFKRALMKPVKLTSTTDLIQDLRNIKDKDEIRRIRKAVEIADMAFSHIVSYLKPGMKELEVAAELEMFMKKNGAEKASFDTIVAAGSHAALPHAKPTDAKLKSGQFVKMDYGAFYKLYASDITRTVALGKATARMKEIYNIVLEAQLRAITAIKPGLKGKDIDAVARNYITEKGYGENFGHGLGHALGLAVHDGPGFSKTSELILVPGMVLTVEPGIYIEGWGGVRIEDDIVVTENGCEVLNRAPKELMVIE